MTIEIRPGESAVGGAEQPTRRSVRRIVWAVVLSILVIVGLTAWVLLVPYESSADPVSGETLPCDAMVEWVPSDEGRRDAEEFDRSCAEAESSRQTIALLAGATVATMAAAVSTWPSRRLTGEELGPLR